MTSSQTIRLHSGEGFSAKNPPTITLTADSGALFIMFNTDPLRPAKGWSANFSAGMYAIDVIFKESNVISLYIYINQPLESGWLVYSPENGYNFLYPHLLRVNMSFFIESNLIEVKSAPFMFVIQLQNWLLQNALLISVCCTIEC